MNPALEVRDLFYHFPDGTEALRHLSFTVMPGECVAILGPNGAGKSTLMLHLNGILPDESHTPGAVIIDGEPISAKNLDRIRRKVGLLFQDADDQLFCPTVFEDVAFGPKQFGLAGEQLNEIVSNALAQVGMRGFEKRAPHRLSGGEKRRICLAGVLACGPSVLVLDEPTSNFDPRGRRELIALLKGIRATKLIATHDLEMVVELCERTIVIDRGEILADGLTKDVLSDEAFLLAHGLERPYSLRPVARFECQQNQPSMRPA